MAVSIGAVATIVALKAGFTYVLIGGSKEPLNLGDWVVTNRNRTLNLITRTIRKKRNEGKIKNEQAEDLIADVNHLRKRIDKGWANKPERSRLSRLLSFWLKGATDELRDKIWKLLKLMAKGKPPTQMLEAPEQSSSQN